MMIGTVTGPSFGYTPHGNRGIKSKDMVCMFGTRLLPKHTAAPSRAGADIPTAPLLSGEAYWNLRQSCTGVNSTAKGSAEHRALIASLCSADATGGVEPIVSQLSEPSKATLEAIQAGVNISEHQWTALCRELKENGIITSEEFNAVRADIYFVPDGYEPHPVATMELRALYARSKGIYIDTEMWTGNPFDFLNTWAALLDDWQGMLAKEEDESGAAKYTDFSPIKEEIHACHKVSELLQQLIAA